MTDKEFEDAIIDIDINELCILAGVDPIKNEENAAQLAEYLGLEY